MALQQPGPRPLSPQDGRDWLGEAALLLLHHPLPFLAAALVAPAGSALLLSLPLWKLGLFSSSGWLAVVATVVCYCLPLNLAVCLSCGLARTTTRNKPLPLGQLLVPAVLRVLVRTSLFLLALQLQAYLAVYLIQDLVNPATLMAGVEGNRPAPDPNFGIGETLLGTQLTTIGALLLIMQVLLAMFVPPLHLFRELAFAESWRLSFRALQLNPWLGLALGLPGLLMILLSLFPWLGVVAQVMALPLPAYLGALLYIAWREIFQGGEEETEEERQWQRMPAGMR
ncbi:MAG: hypothetical protein R3310_13240 [Candidatus Competibacteraceae bacterium]|nr:hypothetical protein [Candidatus Competibacteraceae bacterium]